MKKLTYLFLLAIMFVGFSAAQGQDNYYILAVKGKIYNQTTKKYLKSRTKIKATNKVVFKDKNAVAILFSRGKGRFKLRLKNKKSSSELSIFVNKTLFAQKQGAITRASTAINNVAGFAAHFKRRVGGKKKYLILGDKLMLKVNPKVFENLGKGTPYIRYKYNGKDVNKALKYENNTLIIDKNELFKVDGESIQEEQATDFIISYYVASKEASVYLDEPESNKHLAFEPVFVTKKTLEDQGVVALAEYLKAENANESEVAQEVASALLDIGVANKENVKDWYKKNIK